MWGSAWERYGQKFVESFDRYWPGDVELTIVTDRPLPTSRARQIPLDTVPGIDFLTRWTGSEMAEGRTSNDGKAQPGKRFWKHDAVKWAPQCLAPVSAIDGLSSGDLCIWLDADVETIAPVPDHWGNILMNGKDVACLLRGKQHPEIGFWAVRVGTQTLGMVDKAAEIYTSDAVFDLPEWHSAYVWGEALKFTPGLTVNNLNRTMMRGHCWPHTALARYTIHKKGKIKDA
jgi:hypothetical protein